MNGIKAQIIYIVIAIQQGVVASVVAMFALVLNHIVLPSFHAVLLWIEYQQ